MKKLFLIRHAKSDWSDTSLNDFDRPLNKRGLREAPFMAKLLKNRDEKPDLIICSPSNRTKQTLEYFIKELEYKKDEVVFKEKLYVASFDNLLKIIRNIDDSYEIVCLIGHNPGICDLVNYLLGKSFENIPTCGIVQINFDVKKWVDISKNNSELIFFKHPKMYQ